MSDIGYRAFWDHETNGVTYIEDDSTSMIDTVANMISKIEILEKRIEQLETAYMELKMLGSDPGKIEK